MTRSTSKNQFLESLDQDDELEIRLHQQRQPQTTPTHQIGSSQPQPVKRNHTVDLWGRAYYEPSRNSSLTRTPSKKRNAQGESIRFMSPPRRAFDPLSYGLLTQYKLKIPHLSDQEDNDGTQEEIDSDQDDSSALATQEEEEDSFRTPKRKRKSRFPLMKLERPFAAQSRCQTSGLERDEQGPEEVSDLNAGYPDDGADPDKEELYDGTVQDDEYLDEEGPYDVDLGGEDLAGEEDDQLAVDQEAEVQGDDDFVTQVIQEAKAREDVRNDSSEEGNEGSKGGSSVQSTPSKYCQRDRLLHDLSSSGSSHFLGIDFQTPPRKTATRDHFNNLQPPPAPRVPDWAMFSLSDRQSRYGTPGWIPPSGSQAGDSPSRSRSLRTPSFGSKLGSSKNPRN
ncbi:hypothetical protein BG003_010793 [Podila horticola]|nr:hypothetical protein BG003_010793 [Podila horticola]